MPSPSFLPYSCYLEHPADQVLELQMVVRAVLLRCLRAIVEEEEEQVSSGVPQGLDELLAQVLLLFKPHYL